MSRLATADALEVRGARGAGRGRTVVVTVALGVATVTAFLVSVAVGDFPIPLGDLVPATLGLSDGQAGFVVQNLRLPRALTALFAGAAFGLSGAIFQALARNPLASPDIIGITAGASASAVFAIVIIEAGDVVVSVGALAGALVTAAAIYLLAYRRGVSAYRLVLVGIGIAAFLSAVTSYLLIEARIIELVRATAWLTGSLTGRDWSDVWTVAIPTLALAPVALLLGRPLRALLLGDETAVGLGLQVERTRALLVFVAVALAAFATAAAGPIAFVAFVSPAIARGLVRVPVTLVSSALAGAVLVLVADVIGRRVFAPNELPVGVVTALVGGPYLLLLLYRANRTGVTG